MESRCLAKYSVSVVFRVDSSISEVFRVVSSISVMFRVVSSISVVSRVQVPCPVKAWQSEAQLMGQLKIGNVCCSLLIVNFTGAPCKTPAWLRGLGLVLKYDKEYTPAVTLCHKTKNETQTLRRLGWEHQPAALKFPKPPVLSPKDCDRQKEVLEQWRQRFSATLPSPVPAGSTLNRTLVVLIGQARGGPQAWASLFENVLDVSLDHACCFGC